MGKKSLYQIFRKTIAGIIYLTFFLVQFNINLNGTPNNVSYFSCDYSSINNKAYSSNLNQHSIRTDAKHSKFKLNKRFHPERLFTVTSAPYLAVELNYKIQSAL